MGGGGRWYSGGGGRGFRGGGGGKALVILSQYRHTHTHTPTHTHPHKPPHTHTHTHTPPHTHPHTHTHTQISRRGKSQERKKDNRGKAGESGNICQLAKKKRRL